MSFNLFGSPTKDDIRVGYIDPTLGYVDGVSICEANEYAKNNPGTTFVFKDGDNNLQYLNINEVNRLTPNDLSATTDECGGIQQYKECGPPRIQFFGGGGIGAAGNPIIGRDGSLLAVDLVSGGHGYQYPPIMAAKDDCQFGNGAVLTAVLGETVDEIEVFEGEEDFEEYELCPDTDVGYGTVYGPNGEELGPWEPGAYTKIDADPIQREIEIFQKALEKPFWTTRKTQPDRVSTVEKSYATQNTTNVTFPEWGEFMNKYAVSPVKPSDVTGSDEAGRIFSMEWELNFPISGEYIFRGLCDNAAQVYIDDSLVGNLKQFSDNPSPLQKTIQEGNHILKIDLLNVPITEKTTTTSNLKASFVQEGSSFYLQVDGSGSGEINFVMEVDDNPSYAGIAAREVVIPADGGSVVLKRDSNKEIATDKGSGKYTAGKKYGPIQIIGAGSRSRGPIINSKNRLGIRDSDGDDENIKITIGNIKSGASSSIEEGEIISPASWNQNPMGVSMIIEAPLPPVPQEKLPEPIGKCPPNPIWSTRFPNSSQIWFPVRNISTYKFRQGPNDTNSGILGATAIKNALADGLSSSQIEAEAAKQGYPLNENAKAILRASSTGQSSQQSESKTWSKFMSRYAISPVLPLDTPGSDASGSLFSNTWEVDLPYAGFYGVKGTGDSNARLLIDNVFVSTLDTYSVDNPAITKIFLTKGKHVINLEVSNNTQETSSIVDTKIFSTQDWRVSSTPSKQKTTVTFDAEVDGQYANSIEIEGLGVSLSKNFNAKGEKKSFSVEVEYNKVYAVKLSTSKQGSIKLKTKGENFLQAEDATDFNWKDIRCLASQGKFFDLSGSTCKFTVEAPTSTNQSLTKNGVTYEGPSLFSYKESRWSKYMNNFSVSPKVFNSVSEPETPVVGKYTLTWKNVNFPYSGLYKFNFQADNNATLKVGGKEIFKTSDFFGEKVQYTFNVTPGKYDVVVELENVKSDIGGQDEFIFEKNPMGVALFISKDVSLSTTSKTSWVQNPIAVSAILIPPPCAKKIGGRGVVDKVIVNDPGNGYLPPREQGSGYPVTLVLDEVIVENPGINYRCGEDQLQITPNNGAQLSYDCDPFGKIKSVQVLNPGVGFNVYPEISLPSETGVNASFRPVFRVLRDPIEVPPEKIIQVTDLVGLKQTGYVDGRAYYGAIYYDEGVPYAGYYKTAGPQTRVYATLQESITARITTSPSAIQRAGTDVTSNDPRLNIPGTIQDTQS